MREACKHFFVVKIEIREWVALQGINFKSKSFASLPITSLVCLQICLCNFFLFTKPNDCARSCIFYGHEHF